MFAGIKMIDEKRITSLEKEVDLLNRQVSILEKEFKEQYLAMENFAKENSIAFLRLANLVGSIHELLVEKNIFTFAELQSRVTTNEEKLVDHIEKEKGNNV